MPTSVLDKVRLAENAAEERVKAARANAEDTVERARADAKQIVDDAKHAADTRSANAARDAARAGEALLAKRRQAFAESLTQLDEVASVKRGQAVAAVIDYLSE